MGGQNCHVANSAKIAQTAPVTTQCQRQRKRQSNQDGEDSDNGDDDRRQTNANIVANDNTADVRLVRLPMPLRLPSMTCLLQTSRVRQLPRRTQSSSVRPAPRASAAVAAEATSMSVHWARSLFQESETSFSCCCYALAFSEAVPLFNCKSV